MCGCDKREKTRRQECILQSYFTRTSLVLQKILKTKIVEFSPSVVILLINQLYVFIDFFLFKIFVYVKIAIEIVETVAEKDQNRWIPVNPKQVNFLLFNFFKR
jgi:hypothetical protein